MCHWVMIAFAVVAMVRIASHEDLSPWVWGTVGFAICFLCLLVIPLAYLNVLIGLVLSVVAMMAWLFYQRRAR